MVSHLQKADRQIAEKATPSDQSTPTSSASPIPSATENAGMLASLGIISAFLSLLIVPEIFGAVAIVLGAYTWRRERGNRGLYIVVAGILCMLVGIYFTSLFELADLLPS